MAGADGQDILHFGGTQGSLTIPNVYRFPTVDWSTTTVNKLTEAFTGIGVVSDGDQIAYLFGGSRGGGGILSDDILRYNGSSDVFDADAVAALPGGEGRRNAAVTWDSLRGVAYVFGGIGSAEKFLDILRFEPPSTVTRLPTGPNPPRMYGTAFLDEEDDEAYIVSDAGLYRLGDMNAGVQRLIVNNWPDRLNNFCAVYVPKIGRVYIFGGFGFYSSEELDYREQISCVETHLAGGPSHVNRPLKFC